MRKNIESERRWDAISWGYWPDREPWLGVSWPPGTADCWCEGLGAIGGPVYPDRSPRPMVGAADPMEVECFVEAAELKPEPSLGPTGSRECLAVVSPRLRRIFRGGSLVESTILTSLYAESLSRFPWSGFWWFCLLTCRIIFGLVVDCWIEVLLWLFCSLDWSVCWMFPLEAIRTERRRSASRVGELEIPGSVGSMLVVMCD